MKPSRFSLRIGTKKDRCPACRKLTFTPYCDAMTGHDLTDGSGRCDREMKCGYHQKPDKPTADGLVNVMTPIQHTAPPEPPPVFIPDAVGRWLMDSTRDADFLINLIHHVKHTWPADDVWNIAAKYRVGGLPNIGSNRFKRGFSIPFIDRAGRIHSVMVKSFDRQNHTTDQNWIHAILKAANISREWLTAYDRQTVKTRCLFGEHLITDDDTPIAIVEAPKTALVCDFYFRDMGLTWLAAGAKSWLKPERCAALVDRRIILFPDTSPDGATFKDWTNKAIELRRRISDRVTVSAMMERIATDDQKRSGADMADVLMELDWRTFRTQQSDDEPEINRLQPVQTGFSVGESPVNPDRMTDAEIIEWAKRLTPPTQPLKIAPYATITDHRLFLTATISTIQTYVSGHVFNSYMTNLRQYMAAVANE
jgi:hypothetical protein